MEPARALRACIRVASAQRRDLAEICRSLHIPRWAEVRSMLTLISVLTVYADYMHLARPPAAPQQLYFEYHFYFAANSLYSIDNSHPRELCLSCTILMRNI